MPTPIRPPRAAARMLRLRNIRHAPIAAGVLLAAVWTLYALQTLTGFGGDAVTSAETPMYDGLLIAAAALCLARVPLLRRERLPWLVIGVGLAIWAASDIYYTAALGDLESPPFPSLADAGWLLFYPVTYVAILLLLRSRVRRFRTSLWLDGLLGSLSAAALAAALVFQPIVDAGSGSAAAIATNLAYPVGDLLLLAFVVAAIALTGWRPGRMWLLLGAGLLLSVIADSWYLFVVAKGSYVEGKVLDTLWPASTLLIAAAAWQPREHRADAQLQGWRVLAFPAVFMSLALGILVFDHFQRVTTLAIWLATAALLAGIARMAMSFGENLRMLGASRREALSDPLTGLGNRRRLLSDLDDALKTCSASEPRLLVFFDLNGFKSYNDSYGHPAGDQLLARLGRGLSEVTRPYGNAYRLGGDEFCVLARPGRVGPEIVVASAAAALTEHGEGFTVDSSYGSVLMPSEASDASTVLLLADRRMYSHKNHGRPSAGLQSRDVLLSSLQEREPTLRAHLDDVADLAHMVGRELGMGHEELDELTRAAELHDVGKIAIPDAILNKPGPLEEEEWVFMRRHTLIGERILTAAPALRPVARLVRFSHEHWNGTGYPDGLQGEEIPLGSRVVAVCDAFHAMVSDRPYRAAVPPEAALAELHRYAGKQFDPKVVETFARVIERQALATPE
jgi:two-component system cell cycle response regulator